MASSPDEDASDDVAAPPGSDGHPDATDGAAMAQSLFEYTGQYRSPDLADTAELRERYGWVRTYFLTRPHNHRDLQRWLLQARSQTLYDEYLTWSVYYAVAAGLLGLVLGFLVTLALGAGGLLTGVTLPPTIVRLAPAPLVAIVSPVKEGLLRGLIVVGVGAGLGGLVWTVRYYYPREVASRRQRAIDFALPSAIVFMYALAKGGMSLPDVIDELATASDAYGDISEEFSAIQRDIDLFDSDIYASIRRARKLTPSHGLEQFLTDLVSLLESGGELDSFLKTESRVYLQRARNEQEEYLEFLAVLSEVFVVGLVAAPLFLIVIMVVINLLGASLLLELAAVVYLVLPLGMVGFAVVLSVFSEQFAPGEVELDVAGPAEIHADDGGADDIDADDPVYRQFRRNERTLALLESVSNPVRTLRERPALSMVVTGPLALGVLGWLLTTDRIPTTVAGWVADPVGVTLLVVLVPFYLVTVPYAVFEGLESRRREAFLQRFPETLNLLASANEMGINLRDSLEVVAEWSTGALADELRIVHNDIRWSDDVSGALRRLGNRLGVASMARTLTLVARAQRVSQDLATVLSIAAEDTHIAAELEARRRREMSSYLIVIVIGYLVFLAVIGLLTASFLDPIERIVSAAPAATDEPAFAFGSIPVDTYRLLFFHAVIIQAVGAGVIAGLLRDNRVASGLKYAIAMVTLGTVTFLLL
ncbi:type II secretion system F family protein [Haloglomus litoreum]|uniref:type II secretion system F family protein n=1 Tax=Haloglomus litoreum TaxID=3034026 RepID=UPI0023E78ED8|nr:type II secretion system F family protein [Haloglomus sp. DT116]